MPNYDDIFTEPKQTDSSYSPPDRDEWAAKKQQERREAYALIDDTALSIANGGEPFKTYLDVQARFDRYSVGNALLIAAQMPSATRIASFDDWKSEGVYVRKHQTSFVILEPGKEYAREDGSTGVSYDTKRVFDISQTNARPQQKSAVSRDERLLLKALINGAPCRLSITSDLPDGVNVTYDREENVILLRRGMDAPTIFRGLSQELARAVIDKGDHSCTNPSFASYCVSYMLCKRNGISTENFGFDRIPEEFAGMDAREVRAELTTMRTVAGDIGANMSRFFEEQEHSSKQRDGGAR